MLDRTLQKGRHKAGPYIVGRSCVVNVGADLVSALLLRWLPLTFGRVKTLPYGLLFAFLYVKLNPKDVKNYGKVYYFLCCRV